MRGERGDRRERGELICGTEKGVKWERGQEQVSPNRSSGLSSDQCA